MEALAAAMPFTYACFKESLRMYPPAPFTSRRVHHTVQLGEYLLPRGTLVRFKLSRLFIVDAAWFVLILVSFCAELPLLGSLMVVATCRFQL